jgi:hypothetical protein
MSVQEVQGRWVVVAGLRAWAAGSVQDEAAVELLATLGGRFTSTARPWVRPCQRPGWYWLDPEPMAGSVGRLTSHQERVLALVGALLTGHLRIPRYSAIAPAATSPVESGRAAA